MNRILASWYEAGLNLIHVIFGLCLIVLMSLAATAQDWQTRNPDALNSLPIRPNPTATVTGVCYKLNEKEYSQAIHASCYSEFNKVVVVLVNGKRPTRHIVLALRSIAETCPNDRPAHKSKTSL